MRIAIVAAMFEELEAIKTHVSDLETIHIIANYPAFQGKIEQHDVICAQSGIGKVNAAITTALLIERYQPDYLLNTGIAGGIGADVNIRDVVIATELSYHDVDATIFDYTIGQVPQMPACYPCDKRLNSAIQHINDHQIHRGLIVSGDSFITLSTHLAPIKQNFPDALAVDMEACSIAQTCYQMKVPCCIVRSISDKADEEAGDLCEEFLHTASANSAAVSNQILRALTE